MRVRKQWSDLPADGSRQHGGDQYDKLPGRRVVVDFGYHRRYRAVVEVVWWQVSGRILAAIGGVMRRRDCDEHDVLAGHGRLRRRCYANAVAGSRDQVVANHVVMAGEDFGAWQAELAEAYHAHPEPHAPLLALLQ
jgi:hypothetical protein